MCSKYDFCYETHKKRITFLLITALFQAVSAQVTIKGVIKDNKTKPVAGVSISIKDTYDGGTSDSSGKYSFKTSEKGEQMLVISSIGYKTVEQK